MKTLYLCRHAKSSWDDPALPDEERPLIPQGISKTMLVARFLKERDIQPELMISSHAVRAYETARIIAKELGYSRQKIRVDPAIYDGSEESIADLVSGIDNTVESVMVFGHNPTITQAANLFLHPRIAEMRTSAIVGIRFDTDKWEKISVSAASKDFIIYPGLLKRS